MPSSFIAIKKIDESAHLVYGVASTPEFDGMPGIWRGQRFDGDIVTTEAMRDALDEYMEYANIREMHENKAAGSAIDVTVGDDGVTYIISKITDTEAWKKVVAQTYKGFSIYGDIVSAHLKKVGDKIIRYVTKLTLTEISLVDRPANPKAHILLYKRKIAMTEPQEETPLAPESDTIERVENIIKNLPLEKAAVDVKKLVAQIQVLRNEAELSGNITAAQQYSEVITMLLAASGEADMSLEEVTEEVTEDGMEEEDDLAMAAAQKMKKAGRKISSERISIMKNAVMQYLKMLADVGDEDSIKMIKAVSSSLPQEDTAAKSFGALNDVMMTIAKAVVALNENICAVTEEVSALKNTAVRGGPVTIAGNAVSRSIAKGVVTTPGSGGAGSPNDAQVGELKRLIITENNPVRKRQYADELKKIAGN